MNLLDLQTVLSSLCNQLFYYILIFAHVLCAIVSALICEVEPFVLPLLNKHDSWPPSIHHVSFDGFAFRLYSLLHNSFRMKSCQDTTCQNIVTALRSCIFYVCIMLVDFDGKGLNSRMLHRALTLIKYIQGISVINYCNFQKNVFFYLFQFDLNKFSLF